MEESECIVPAAGRSQRMGRWKPLLPFGHSTIIGTVVAAALSVCPRVILVTGYRGDELAALYREEPRVQIVENEDWPLGMFSSIRRGAGSLSAERFFVSLGDMPWITPAVYTALLRAPRANVVFPTFQGRRGHPVLFNKKVAAEVLRADPAAGSMRDIAAGFSFNELAWEDDTILRDIDTMEDYT